MPIYEYVCDACGTRTEAMQKIAEKPLKKCPACGRSKLRRLVSATAFRLKGGGWYETDFKKDGKKNLHGAADADAKSGKPEDSEKAGAPGKAESAEKSGGKETAEKSPASADKEKPAPKPADTSATKRPKGKKPAAD